MDLIPHSDKVVTSLPTPPHRGGWHTRVLCCAHSRTTPCRRGFPSAYKECVFRIRRIDSFSSGACPYAVLNPMQPMPMADTSMSLNFLVFILLYYLYFSANS